MNAKLEWFKRNWFDVAAGAAFLLLALSAITISAAVLITMLFCSRPAHAVEWPGGDEAARELAKFERFFAYADDWLFVNSDPARRAIACRIGSGAFHIDALARAAATATPNGCSPTSATWSATRHRIVKSWNCSSTERPSNNRYAGASRAWCSCAR